MVKRILIILSCILGIFLIDAFYAMCAARALEFGSRIEASPEAFVWDAPIFFTSYNPVVGQTDSSPCHGATGVNLCWKARVGERTIALSQELVGRHGNKRFTYGDRVRLVSKIPQCNFEAVVLDTMNERWRNRGDIFFLNPEFNTSCYAVVIKIDDQPSL